MAGAGQIEIPLPVTGLSPDFVGFLTLPCYVDLGGPLSSRPFKLVEDLWFRSSHLGRWHCIRAGYRSDLQTIPRFWWRIYNPAGQGRWGAWPHDWLCDNRICDSKTAALVYHEFMLLEGVPDKEARNKYLAVRHFGPQFDAEITVADLRLA